MTSGTDHDTEEGEKICYECLLLLERWIAKIEIITPKNISIKMVTEMSVHA